MIKAVGFDLDGTLFETHVDYCSLNTADLQVLKKHGIDPAEVFGTELGNRRNRAPIRDWLFARGRSDEYREIYDEIADLSTFYEMQFLDDAKAYPRTLETVRALKAKGFKIGLLTRGAEIYGRTVLGRFGILDFFDAIVGRDYSDHDDCKPSPVATYNFAKELGVKPEEILYLGDNLSDWKSAISAGAEFIGVLSGACKAADWAEADPGIRTVKYAGDVIDIIGDYL